MLQPTGKAIKSAKSAFPAIFRAFVKHRRSTFLDGGSDFSRQNGGGAQVRE